MDLAKDVEVLLDLQDASGGHVGGQDGGHQKLANGPGHVVGVEISTLPERLPDLNRPNRVLQVDVGLDLVLLQDGLLGGGDERGEALYLLVGAEKSVKESLDAGED